MTNPDIRQTLNLPPPFSREFYFGVPAIALPFEILRPHSGTQSKDQIPLSDTMSHDSSLTEVLII